MRDPGDRLAGVVQPGGRPDFIARRVRPTWVTRTCCDSELPRLISDSLSPPAAEDAADGLVLPLQVVVEGTGDAKIFFDGSSDGGRPGRATRVAPVPRRDVRRVCAGCWLRVRLTREALRALCEGLSLKPQRHLRTEGWTFPALGVTHCGPHAIITLPLLTAKAPESVCMICARSTSPPRTAASRTC